MKNSMAMTHPEKLPPIKIMDEKTCTSILETAIGSQIMVDSTPEDREWQHQNFLEKFKQLSPLDALEGMLIAQMIMTFNATAHCTKMSLASENRRRPWVFLAMQKEARMCHSLFLRQIKTLNNYRGSQEKIVEIWDE